MYEPGFAPQSLCANIPAKTGMSEGILCPLRRMPPRGAEKRQLRCISAVCRLYAWLTFRGPFRFKELKWI